MLRAIRKVSFAGKLTDWWKNEEAADKAHS
jgi:hypothetical protein